MKQKIRYCKDCGEPFIPVKRQLFCNTTCKQRYYRKRDKYDIMVECELCGNIFIPNHLNRKYCSDDCAKEIKYIKDREFHYKLKREFPEFYYNDLGSRGTSTTHKMFREEDGSPDFKREAEWLKREKKRLRL